MGRLLAAVSVPQSDEIERLKLELLRVRFDEQARGERRRQAGTVIGSAAAASLARDRAEIEETIELGRDDWQTRIETRIRLTSTRGSWRVQADLDAYEGGSRCFCRSWDETIERDHM